MQAKQIETIKRYQDLDMQLYSLENEFIKSQEFRAVHYLKDKYLKGEKSYARLLKEKDDQIDHFEKIIKKFDELKVIEENIDQDINEIKDLVELDLYEDSLLKYEECVTSIDKEINRSTRKLNEIKIEVERLLKAIEALKSKYIEQKAILDNLKKEVLMKGAPLKKEMNSLEEHIDKNFLKKYRALRKEKKMPPFVQYLNGNCAGCGMQINLEVEKKLINSGDYTECPECRRIVYKP